VARRERQEGEWLTIAEIAAKTDIPETTLRRYAQTFRDYLPSETDGRATRYPPEAVQTFQQIAWMYQQGHKTREIRQWLASKVPPSTTVVVEDSTLVEAQSRVVQQLLETIHEMKTANERMARELEQLRAELAAAREEARQREEERKAREEERDKAIAELQQGIKELAAREWSTLTLDDVRQALAEARQPWWKRWRWFSKG